MKRIALLLAFVLSVAPGCRRHGADGIPFEHQHELDYTSFAEDPPPAEASRVEIHETRNELPDAFYSDEYGATPQKRFTAAPGYPSEERPHRVLGTISLKERVDVSGYDDEELEAALNDEALRARGGKNSSPRRRRTMAQMLST